MSDNANREAETNQSEDIRQNEIAWHARFSGFFHSARRKRAATAIAAAIACSSLTALAFACHHWMQGLSQPVVYNNNYITQNTQVLSPTEPSEANTNPTIIDNYYSDVAPLDLPSILKSRDEFMTFVKALEHENGSLTWDPGEIRFDHTSFRGKTNVSISKLDGKYVSAYALDELALSDIETVYLTCYVLSSSNENALEAIKALFKMPDLITSTSYYGRDPEDTQPYESIEGISFEWRHQEGIEWNVQGSLHQIDTLGDAKAYQISLNLVPYLSLIQPS